MKAITRLKTSMKRKKQKKTSQDGKAKKHRSIVSKYSRNAKAWNLRQNRRLQQCTTTSIEVDNTRRTCLNCGEQYTGRICPQCGQSGSWSRYTWHQAILNFLDIWGLGNRPIFRTIAELFWRPGYMIRDYLEGHRQFYFPPFKLVAVSVLLLIFVGLLTGNQSHSLLGEITEHFGLSEANGWEDVKVFAETHFAHFNLSSALLSITTAITWLVWFLSRNLLYEYLFIGTAFFICIWIAFIRVNRYNFVETYIFLTYVLAQILLCMIPSDVLSWIHNGIQAAANTGTSSALMQTVYSGLMGFTKFLDIVFTCVVCFLLLLDFRQFFGLSWKSTLVHLLLTFVVTVMLVLGVGSIASTIVAKNISSTENWVTAVISILLVAQGFYFASKFFDENKELVPKSVIIGCKTAMLSILFIGKADMFQGDSFMVLVGNIFLIVLYAMLSVALSLLPVVVYKKYHRKWLALLSLSAALILVILVN